MEHDLWEAEHKCLNCNKIMKKKELIVEGIKVRGWECSNCNETVLHPEDAQKMFIMIQNEMSKRQLRNESNQS